MGSIKWIQLSDLHFGHESQYTKDSRKHLLDYLKESDFSVDYLFITGDLIYAKDIRDIRDRKSAYDEAAKYIQDVSKVLWHKFDEEIVNSRIFIVPGNHDVIRNKAREGIIDTIQKEYLNSSDGKIENSLLNNCTESLKGYYELLKQIGKDLSCCSGKHNYVIKTEKANVLHLNTCISSGKDDEDSTLILGYDLLSKAMEEIDENLPTIAIAHHSIECLGKEEQKRVELLLKEKGVVLYLCGHSHERESSIILRYNQSRCLNLFTTGTLMAGDCNNYQDTVFFSGEYDDENSKGKVFSHKWTLDNKWHKDMDFGLVQEKSQSNYRIFRSGNLFENSSILSFGEPSMNGGGDFEKDGVVSKIVSHTSPERSHAFAAVNERAKTALSVYGIGITHVSKNEELLEKILKSGGRVRLCMMDPSVFKSGMCKSLIEEKKGRSCISIKIDGCDIDSLRFCIDASHMDAYIREEYADDVQKSYKRLLRLRKKFLKKSYDIKVKILKSFVPISLNIVNEDEEENTELIAEYNMPFVTKRLLIHLRKKQDSAYYEEMKKVFEKIWEQAEEVQDEG